MCVLSFAAQRLLKFLKARLRKEDMTMDECAICYTPVDEENAPVLEIGAYGRPKYLCPECSADLDSITLGKDLETIRTSMNRLTKKIEVGGLSKKTFTTLTSILDRAAVRAKAIESGSYDFTLDENEDDGELAEIPEELLETEEDKILDELDAEKEERNSRIFDYISFGIFLLLFGVAAYKFIIPWIVDLFK